MNINQSNVALTSLQSREWEILRNIFVRFAGQFFGDSQMMKLRMKGVSGAEHQLSFLKLRKSGYIRVEMNSWGEKQYYIVKEQLPRLHQLLYTHELQEVREEVHIMKEATPGLVLDLFHVLVLIGRDQLHLTTKGTVHKKSIQKISEKLNLKVEDLNEISLHISQHEGIPLHIALILDLLYDLELISKESRDIVVQEKRVKEWLHLNTAEMTSILLRMVFERYCSDHAEMQHLYCLICQPTYMEGQWVELEVLVDWMIQQQMLDPSQRCDIDRRARMWLIALAGCGWMDVGNLEDHRLCFRWSVAADEVRNAFFTDLASCSTPSTNSRSRFYVQPDFDIIVFPDVPYAWRTTLIMFTEITKIDRMSIYRITKDSIHQAAKRGMDADELIAFMTEYSATGVPEHVSLTMRHWFKELSEAEVVICPTEAIMFHRDLSTRSEHEVENDDRMLIIREYFSGQCVHTQNDIPIPQSLFQGLEQIPVMWVKDFRSYHPSTGIHLMEQALLWKTKVKLSFDAKEVDFIPLRVTLNPYEIAGEIYNPNKEQYEEIELTPGDWKEMRLIVPNFT